MKYLVLECRLSYAVVLDEEGQALKVANRHYEVGQVLDAVYPMQFPAQKRAPARRILPFVAAMAACLLLAVGFGSWFLQATYASVFVSINPQLRVDVTRRDTVVGLEPLNADAQVLIANYSYAGKDLELVLDELVVLAEDYGYLQPGGGVSLVLDANETWVSSHTEPLQTRLSGRLDSSVTITITVGNSAAPTNPRPNSGDSGYGDDSYPQTEDGDSGYGGAQSGDSGFDDPDDDDNAFGDSGYQPPVGGGSVPPAGGDSNYTDGQTNYGGNAADDGNSPYVPDTGSDDGNSPYVPDTGSDGGNSPYVPEQNDDGGSSPYVPEQSGDDGGNSDFS